MIDLLLRFAVLIFCILIDEIRNIISNIIEIIFGIQSSISIHVADV